MHGRATISYVLSSLGRGMPGEQKNPVSGQRSLSEASGGFEEEKETVTQDSETRRGHQKQPQSKAGRWKRSHVEIL